MKRILNTALMAVATAGALALTAAPAAAQYHHRGYHSYGGYRGGYNHRGYGGFGFGLSFGSPSYYGYGYPYYGYNNSYYNNCWVWSPYYGRYVTRPGCYDNDYYGY